MTSSIVCSPSSSSQVLGFSQRDGSFVQLTVEAPRDPEKSKRYMYIQNSTELSHPGDIICFDIITQYRNKKITSSLQHELILICWPLCGRHVKLAFWIYIYNLYFYTSFLSNSLPTANVLNTFLVLKFLIFMSHS